MVRLVVLAITLVACGRATTPAKAGSGDTKDQALLAKLKVYSDCLDQHSQRVFDVEDLYRERMSDKDALIGATYNPRKCVLAMEKAKKLEPQIAALDAAGDAYGTALQTVYDLTREGHDHYDSAMRDRLLAGFAGFEVAQGALFDQVFRLNREAHLDQLARREQQEGDSLLVLADRTLLDAEATVHYAAIPADHLERLDEPGLTAGLHALERSYDELTAYAVEHPTDTDNMKGYWTFADYAHKYIFAVRQLLQRAHDHVAYTDAEKLVIASGNEGAVAGAPRAMIEAYNHFVDTYAW